MGLSNKSPQKSLKKQSLFMILEKKNIDCMAFWQHHDDRNNTHKSGIRCSQQQTPKKKSLFCSCWNSFNRLTPSTRAGRVQPLVETFQDNVSLRTCSLTRFFPRENRRRTQASEQWLCIPEDAKTMKSCAGLRSARRASGEATPTPWRSSGIRETV